VFERFTQPARLMVFMALEEACRMGAAAFSFTFG